MPLLRRNTVGNQLTPGCGTLAILAREPGKFSAEHLTILEILARQVVTRLELYRAMRVQEQAQRTLQRTERALATERCFVPVRWTPIPFLAALLNTDGRMVRLNYPCMQLTGLTQFDAVGLPFIEHVLELPDRRWQRTSCARPPRTGFRPS